MSPTLPTNDSMIIAVQIIGLSGFILLGAAFVHAASRLRFLMQFDDVRLLDVLWKIESGDLDIDLRRVDNGDLAVYRVSNGWMLKVFDDCGSWDYVAMYRTADDPLTWTEPGTSLLRYRPPLHHMKLWGFPEGGKSPAGFRILPTP